MKSLFISFLILFILGNLNAQNKILKEDYYYINTKGINSNYLYQQKQDSLFRFNCIDYSNCDSKLKKRWGIISINNVNDSVQNIQLTFKPETKDTIIYSNLSLVTFSYGYKAIRTYDQNDSTLYFDILLVSKNILTSLRPIEEIKKEEAREIFKRYVQRIKSFKVEEFEYKRDHPHHNNFLVKRIIEMGYNPINAENRLMDKLTKDELKAIFNFD